MSYLGELSLERLEHEIVQLAAHVNAGMCRWLELVAEFDRREGWGSWGCKSCADWVAWRCALEPRAAREHVHVARKLDDLPRIHAGFREGRLSYSKVRALTRIAKPESEDELLELAEHATAAQLERICRALRRVSTAEANEIHENRYLTWFWEDDGSLSIHASLSPEDGAMLLTALDAAHQRLRRNSPEVAGSGSAEPPATTEDGGSAEPPVPRRATNADALVAMAQTSLDASEADSGARTELVVHVDAATFARDAEGRCHLDHGSAIAPETARRLGCDGAVALLSERAGHAPNVETHPLSVGQRTRAIPAAIKRALQARDGTCRFPGCENRLHLDAHHVHHWANGGDTSLGNLVRLCRHHHRLVHEGGYSLESHPGGDLRFLDPRRRLIHEAPRPPDGDADQLRLMADDGEVPWPGSGKRSDQELAIWILANRSAAIPG